MLNFVLKKPSKCALKIAAHKPWDSFQKYFRVDANHLSCWSKWGTKSVPLTPAFFSERDRST